MHRLWSTARSPRRLISQLIGRENRDSRTDGSKADSNGGCTLSARRPLVQPGPVYIVCDTFEIRGEMNLFSSTRLSLFSKTTWGPEDVRRVRVTDDDDNAKETSEGSNEHRFTLDAPNDTKGPNLSGGQDAFPSLP